MTPEQIAELERLEQKAWAAPWTARTFEIECPCPNGEDCGDLHSCEEVEAREAYPASHEEPAEEGEGQCVVQISVPGLESLARPTADFIAAMRNATPSLLSSARDLAALRAAVEALAGEWERLGEEMRIRRWPEAQAADEAERDTFERCARELRKALLPGGDASAPDIQANMQVGMPIICPRCSVKNWDQTAAAAHARWCGPSACEACGGGAGESLYSSDRDDLLRCYACNQALDGG